MTVQDVETKKKKVKKHKLTESGDDVTAKKSSKTLSGNKMDLKIKSKDIKGCSTEEEPKVKKRKKAKTKETAESSSVELVKVDEDNSETKVDVKKIKKKDEEVESADKVTTKSTTGSKKRRRKRERKMLPPLPYPDPGAFEKMLVTIEPNSVEKEVTDEAENIEPIIKEDKPKKKTPKRNKHASKENKLDLSELETETQKEKAQDTTQEKEANTSDGKEEKTENKEKKPKKKRRLRKSTKKQKIVENERKQTKDNAVEYLQTWKSDKENWSFKKNVQSWLLKHIYDKESISDDCFEILLEYLQGAKGYAKTKTIKEAEKCFADQDSGTGNKLDEIKETRARQLAQHLSVEPIIQ